MLELKSYLRKTGFARTLIFGVAKKPFSCIHVWGKEDSRRFSGLTPKKQRELLEKIKSPDISGFIFADGIQVPPPILEGIKKDKRAIFLTLIPKAKCLDETERILKTLAKKIVIPGGLLKVYGVGVLIVGDSGIGKSESALELVARGHLFVSDDVTQVKRIEDNKLVGTAPSLSQNFMEIRGLSIINIKEIFGSKAVCEQAQVRLVVNLKKWEYGKKYDRLGLEAPEEYEILGVKIPEISIPVAPGRTIATLIEVACKVHILRERGYHAPEEIAKKLDRALALK